MSTSGANPGTDDVFASAWLPYTNWNATPRPSETPLASSFATLIMPVILRLPKLGSLGTMISFEDTSAFEAIVRNMLHEGSFQLVRQQSMDRQVMYMIFHRLVNDGHAVQALDSPETKLDHLFKTGITYCLSLGNEVLMNIINATPSPYNLALIQNIFSAALILGNGLVLGMIMSMDRERFVDRPVTLGYAQYYPLEYTSLKGYLQATQVLLDSGADPNQQMFADHMLIIAGNLPAEHPGHAVGLQILRLLFDHGLEFESSESSSIALLLSRCDEQYLPLLATHCLDMSFQIFFQKRALPCILWRKDLDNSFFELLEAILDRASSASSGHRDLWNEVLSTSLYCAVLRSYVSASDLLLAKGAMPDDVCLTGAVRGNDLKILVEFLDRGLDPNAEVIVPYCEDPSRRPLQPETCTALGEAITNRSKGAFEILQARRYVSELAHQSAGFTYAFVAACQVGDSRLMNLLLQLQSFPSRLKNIENALEAAMGENQHHIIEQLLSLGIRPSLRCLYKAIQSRRLEPVKLLTSCMDIYGILRENNGLYSRYDPVRDARDEEYNDAILFEVLSWGDQIAIDCVLRSGHPVNVCMRPKFNEFHDWKLDLRPPGRTDYWNIIPLSAAIVKRNSAAVKALMTYGARLLLPHQFNSRHTSHQATPIESRWSYGDGWTLTPLSAAVFTDDLPLLEEFLRLGVDPFDNSALFVCIMRDFENAITLILFAFRARYPDGVHYFGSDALYQVIRRKNMQLLRILAMDTDITGPVEEDWRTTPDGHWPFRRSVNFTSPLAEAFRLFSESDDTGEVIDVLLPLVKDHNTVVHQDDKFGNMTSLLYAISLGSLEIVQRLQQAGANISSPAEVSITRTPLQTAAQAESKEIVEYLLGQGVSPNEPPAVRTGATALQLAAITGNISIATTLLKAGAEINAPPAFFDGRTAFEGATEHGRVEMMIFLVDQGADLLANGNAQYQRAIAFAEENLQHAAKAVADELYTKALASQGPSFIDMGGEQWAGYDTPDFGSLF